MASNKVYSGTWHVSIPVGGWSDNNFLIQSVGREMKIKSIALFLAIYEIGLTARHDWRTMLSRIQLTTADQPERVCHSFNTGAVLPAYMGNSIEIYEPGQYKFDSFFVVNRLLFNMWIFNNDATDREFWYSIVVETEEKTIFL